MPHRIRRHLSFANVASLSALVFAMGGTGYAVTIAKNSVGSAQLKRNAVANSDIRANAVTSPKVKDRSLRAVDFAVGQLPVGTTGATGQPGQPGLQGIQGPAGVVGAITVVRKEFTVGASSSTSDLASCPAGTRIIGGGAALATTTLPDIPLTASRPDLAGAAPSTGQSLDGWRAAFANPAGGTATAEAIVFAVCAQG